MDGEEFVEKLIEGKIPDWKNGENAPTESNSPSHHSKKRKIEAKEFPAIPIPVLFNHVIMNLPASAVKFLSKDLLHFFKEMNDDFSSEIFKKMGKYFKDRPLPTIHCYGFSNAENPKEDIVKVSQ
jgi:hypothetical protein